MISIRYITHFSLVTLGFLCSSALNISYATDTFEQLEIKNKRTNQEILQDVGGKLQDHSTSQIGFYDDRIEYYEECLARLRNMQRTALISTIFPQESISDLQVYYEQNLRVSQSNKTNILNLESIISDYLSSDVKGFSPINGAARKFRQFLQVNGFWMQLLNFDQAQEAALIQLRRFPNATIEELDSVYYEELKRYGLEEIANDFSKALSLSAIFENYLGSQTSFLMSRHHARLAGQDVPSTKLEDWPKLDKFDREKVNISCTGFGNFLSPLVTIYKALQQVSGGQDPAYLLDQEAQQLLGASKMLLPYLNGQESIIFSDLLNPDAFLADVESFEKLDIPFVAKVMQEIKESYSEKTPQISTTTQLVPQKPLSRQERRAFNKKAKKEEAKWRNQRVKKSTTSVLPKVSSRRGKTPVNELKNLKLESGPSTQPNQRQTQKTLKKVEIQQIESTKTTTDSVNPNPILTLNAMSEPFAPLDLTSPSPSPSIRPQEEEKVPVLKPKRWRGDFVVKEKNKEKTVFQQLMGAVEENQNQESSANESRLRITRLVDEDNLSKTALGALNLLCDKKTHPYTITRKEFLHLLEELGVKATPTTGSIYSLSYTNLEGQEKTKTMHIWKKLGRNMMKRARFVLLEFGLLEQ